MGTFSDECVAFLISLGQEAGLEVRVLTPKKNKPVVVMTMKGSDGNLPTLLLNSHMDVVPVHRVRNQKYILRP